jgi:dTDP-4-amino-4,6-dideoxygalactose transaminase
VHQIGMPCDLRGILSVAERRGIPVIEDAACAIGSEVELDDGWQRIGKPNGLLACFSLHPRKIVTTGDGGMVTTADPKLAARLRLLRQHGMSVPDTVRHGAKQVIFEQYVEPAFNFRMTDLQAAVGRPQLQRLTAIVSERRALAERYAQALADSPLFVTPTEPPGARSNWQSYALRLRPEAGVGQVEAMQYLLDRGIASKRGISNAHQEPAYADRSLWSCGTLAGAECEAGRCPHLAVSERLRDTTILIPLFHGMSRDEQDYVIQACQQLAARGGS